MIIHQPKHKPRRLSKRERERLRNERSVNSENKRQRDQEKLYGSGTFTFNPTAPRRGSTTNHIPSRLEMPVHKTKEQVRLSEEMLERERIAQAEIERKKKCVAPAFNKGGYIYISSKEDAKDAGK